MGKVNADNTQAQYIALFSSLAHFFCNKTKHAQGEQQQKRVELGK